MQKAVLSLNVQLQYISMYKHATSDNME